jgi:hypothetical protein
MIENRGFVKIFPNFFGVRTGFVVIFGDTMTVPSLLRTFWLGIVGVSAPAMLPTFIYILNQAQFAKKKQKKQISIQPVSFIDPPDIFTLHNRFILGLKNVV